MPTLIEKINVLSHLPKIFLNLFLNKPIALSFDISGACNLNCPYCYWQQSKRNKQLSLKEIVKIAKKYRKQGILQATWVGGEPTLRPDVLKAVTPIFPINWIVTNGIPLQGTAFKDFDLFSLPNTWIILSIDGVGAVHDKSRNRLGLYKLVKERFWNKPVMITTTLHQGNKDQPDKLLKEWSKSDILGIAFEFATPIGRKADKQWDLVGEQRDKIIDQILELKKQYGDFICNSTYSLNQLRSKNLKNWTGAPRCPTSRFSISLDELGEKKKPCILGSSPNNKKGQVPSCANCGCHVPSVIEGLKNFDLETIKLTAWFLRNKNLLK